MYKLPFGISLGAALLLAASLPAAEPDSTNENDPADRVAQRDRQPRDFDRSEPGGIQRPTPNAQRPTSSERGEDRPDFRESFAAYLKCREPAFVGQSFAKPERATAVPSPWGRGSG